MPFEDWTSRLHEIAGQARSILKSFQETLENEDLENMFHVREMEQILKDLKKQLDEMLEKATDKLNSDSEKLKAEREACEKKFEDLKAKVETIRKAINEKMDQESFRKALESLSHLRTSPMMDEIRNMAESLEKEMEELRENLKQKFDDLFKK
jgi:chaperonin cofactor prefoldin